MKKQESRRNESPGDPRLGSGLSARTAYPEGKEANGQVRLPFVAPVSGLLQQGHQRAAGTLGLPAFLRSPGQQELQILPKCVWAKHSKV